MAGRTGKGYGGEYKVGFLVAHEYGMLVKVGNWKGKCPISDRKRAIGTVTPSGRYAVAASTGSSTSRARIVFG